MFSLRLCKTPAGTHLVDLATLASAIRKQCGDTIPDLEQQLLEDAYIVLEQPMDGMDTQVSIQIAKALAAERGVCPERCQEDLLEGPSDDEGCDHSGDGVEHDSLSDFDQYHRIDDLIRFAVKRGVRVEQRHKGTRIEFANGVVHMTNACNQSAKTTRQEQTPGERRYIISKFVAGGCRPSDCTPPLNRYCTLGRRYRSREEASGCTATSNTCLRKLWPPDGIYD